MMGIGTQTILATFTLVAINKIIHKYQKDAPILQNKSITDMLQVYALICMIIALVSTNEISYNLLELAP